MNLNGLSQIEYIKDINKFDGFFAFEDNRTPIPNQYFDYVISNETLGTIKVVGLVIRNTLGWLNKFGNQKTVDPIAYSLFKEKMNFKSNDDDIYKGKARALRQAVTKLIR